METIKPYVLGLRRLANRFGPIKTYPTLCWEYALCRTDWSEVGTLSRSKIRRSQDISLKDARERRICNGCQRV